MVNFKYYKSTRFKTVYYSVDSNDLKYVFRDYSWAGPKKYWQQATWKDEMKFINDEVQNPQNTQVITENQLHQHGIPSISSKTSRMQPPYEYFQDNEEDWIYYSRNESGKVYLYRDFRHPSYSSEVWGTGKWEEVEDAGFRKYCLDTMRAMSQSNPRTEEYLITQNIPLMNPDEVIPSEINHI